jgi:hypothetical protein
MDSLYGHDLLLSEEMLLLDRSLAALRTSYTRLGGDVMGVRFPLAYGSWSPQQCEILAALNAHAPSLRGWMTAKEAPDSQAVHAALKGELREDDGWQVEGPGGGRIPLPREHGLNEEEIGGYVNPDAWHSESGTLVEIEGSGAIENGAILKRITERGVLGAARHFVAIVPWQFCNQTRTKTYNYTFRDIIKPEYERAALALFETYTVFCAGGQLRADPDPGEDSDRA